MPEKYHIETKKIAPRLPKVGKVGVVDWREDCAGCHNCVKKACVYDRYRQEAQYIKDIKEVNTFFFECMGCFSCVQKCTKGLLSLATNPAYERMGNGYFTPDIILATWNQAETASIPVSGAGYRGKFTGDGFDSMWTDMSEIVRPTRDGIHGREYISTAVDIGRKPSLLTFEKDVLTGALPPLVNIPIPLIIDMLPAKYFFPQLLPVFVAAAVRTGTMVIVDWKDQDLLGAEKERYMSNIVFFFDKDSPLPPVEVIRNSRLVEIGDGVDVLERINEFKSVNPEIVVAVRVALDALGEHRAIELAHQPAVEVIHAVADVNGNRIGAENPGFIKDIVRGIHTSLVKDAIRDEITIISGGGIALAEHMAKQIICGADLVTIDLPLLIALECQLCRDCRDGFACPARIEEADAAYAVGRMTNLIAAWHDQLIEVMGAMGIREVRRLRGETGRALFFEDLEEDTFGRLFGTRK
jgi:ferredoxin